MKMLKRSDIVAKLEANKMQIFSMLYRKADGSLRRAVCRLHVQNPKHTLVPGTGAYIGQSAEEALRLHNNIKYFDCNIDGNPRNGQTFGKGDFRTAKIDRIKELTINGETYEIVD